MNSMPFRQLKSFLKILIGVQYETAGRISAGRLLFGSEYAPFSFENGALVEKIQLFSAFCAFFARRFSRWTRWRREMVSVRRMP